MLPPSFTRFTPCVCACILAPAKACRQCGLRDQHHRADLLGIRHEPEKPPTAAAVAAPARHARRSAAPRGRATGRAAKSFRHFQPAAAAVGAVAMLPARQPRRAHACFPAVRHTVRFTYQPTLRYHQKTDQTRQSPPTPPAFRFRQLSVCAVENESPLSTANKQNSTTTGRHNIQAAGMTPPFRQRAAPLPETPP